MHSEKFSPEFVLNIALKYFCVERNHASKTQTCYHQTVFYIYTKCSKKPCYKTLCAKIIMNRNVLISRNLRVLIYMLVSALTFCLNYSILKGKHKRVIYEFRWHLFSALRQFHKDIALELWYQCYT